MSRCHSQPILEITKMLKESLDYNYVRGTGEDPKIDLFRFREALYEFNIDESKVPKTLKWYKFIDESGNVVDFYGDPI